MANGLEKVTTAAIICNGAVFVWGLADPVHAEIADGVEHALLMFFVAEMAVKLRLLGWRFFRQPMDVFDVVVILLAFLPVLAGGTIVLRAARFVRILHFFRHLPTLRLIELGQTVRRVGEPYD